MTEEGRHPNLYEFATKELAQDATLAYVLKWAASEYRDAGRSDLYVRQMNALGEDLLRALVQCHPKHSDRHPAFTKVDVCRQRSVFLGRDARGRKKSGRLDIVVTVRTGSKNLVIVVEDKINAQTQVGQLTAYVDALTKELNDDSSTVLGVLCKTSNESIPEDKWRAHGIFLRKDLLAVLERHGHVANTIVRDFRAHWRDFENRTQKWRSCPVRECEDEKWEHEQIEGFYLELERQEAEWHWGVDTRGLQQVRNFWADSTMIESEEVPRVKVRLEMENARKVSISAHHEGGRPVSRATLDYLKTVLAPKEGISVGMGLVLHRAHTKGGSKYPRPVHVTAQDRRGFLALNEDDTVDLNETVKRIRRVGDFIQKTPLRVAKRETLSGLVRERLKRFESESPPWRVCPPPERLRIYKKNHWSKIAFSGVWFLWDADDQTFRVGIESPREGVPRLVDGVRKCFEDAGVQISGPRKGGRERTRPSTRWFFGSPIAEDWSWERLCDKSDEELKDYADAVVALMRALAGVIDGAEETEANQAAP